MTEVMIGQKRARTGGHPPELIETEIDGSEKIIYAEQTCRILGASMQDNMAWGIHLETGEESLISDKKKLGILKYLGKYILKRSKKKSCQKELS